jgi:hypothetical protein
VSVSVWQCPANGPVWGTGGPEFKSRRSDQQNKTLSPHFQVSNLPKKCLGKSMGRCDPRSRCPERPAERTSGHGAARGYSVEGDGVDRRHLLIV